VSGSESHHFEGPARFAVGADGEPGSRVFYLQAQADEGPQVSVKCEKQQAAALAEYLEGILADLPTEDEIDPASTQVLPPGLMAWTAGVMAVAYDEPADRIVVMIEELLDDEEAEARIDGPATLRVSLTRGQVATFIGQVRELIAGGRPPCRLCGRPLDPAGHACPRLN
jgi:uncharacterized repeat protein (TIGR03847 family)